MVVDGRAWTSRAAVDGGGNIWVADTRNNRIAKCNSSGVFQLAFGSLGDQNGQLQGPAGTGGLTGTLKGTAVATGTFILKKPGKRVTRAKNIQVIDGALNCTYGIFAASEEDLREIFPQDRQDVEFVEDFLGRVGRRRGSVIFKRLWSAPVDKEVVRGIHGSLFYQLEYKKEFYPTKREKEMATGLEPDGADMQDAAVKPDWACGAYSGNKKITIKLIDDMVLVEGEAEAIEFLGKLLLAQANEEKDCSLFLGPRSAGRSFFTKKSTHGFYIHRLPCREKPPAARD